MTSRFLNIGSGPHYMPGWINVDLYADDADVRCNASNLPYRSWTFDRVYLGHVLEHNELFAAVPEILREVARVCVPSATIAVVGPCMDKARATRQPEWLLKQMGRQPSPTKPGAGHEWTSTTELTLLALEYVGYEAIKEVPVASILRPEWPNQVTAPWQFAITARPPT